MTKLTKFRPSEMTNMLLTTARQRDFSAGQWTMSGATGVIKSGHLEKE